MQSASKMVARSFQKTRLELRNFIFFFLFFSPPSAFTWGGDGGVQLSWNVANLRANRRVFRMCSDSETGEFRLVVQYERATKANLRPFCWLVYATGDVIFFFFSFLWKRLVHERRVELKIFHDFSLSAVFRNEEL